MIELHSDRVLRGIFNNRGWRCTRSFHWRQKPLFCMEYGMGESAMSHCTYVYGSRKGVTILCSGISPYSLISRMRDLANTQSCPSGMTTMKALQNVYDYTKLPLRICCQTMCEYALALPNQATTEMYVQITYSDGL